MLLGVFVTGVLLAAGSEHILACEWLLGLFWVIPLVHYGLWPHSRRRVILQLEHM